MIHIDIVYERQSHIA